ncbi:MULTISPECIES: hypothetical protein [Thermoanaerobacter]|nr:MULTISPECIES: hypothetical protein [Thermoanaerobacter]
MYLFNASKVEVKNSKSLISDGDYTDRKEWLIRILKEAKLEGANTQSEK